MCELQTLQTNFTQIDIDSRVKHIQSNCLNKIKGLRGIVVFEVSGWNDASGHFTLWDGTNLVYVGPGEHNNPRSPEYYFWLFRKGYDNKKKKEVVLQTNKVIFWELK